MAARSMRGSPSLGKTVAPYSMTATAVNANAGQTSPILPRLFISRVMGRSPDLDAFIPHDGLFQFAPQGVEEGIHVLLGFEVGSADEIRWLHHPLRLHRHNDG